MIQAILPAISASGTVLRTAGVIAGKTVVISMLTYSSLVAGAIVVDTGIRAGKVVAKQTKKAARMGTYMVLAGRENFYNVFGFYGY